MNEACGRCPNPGTFRLQKTYSRDGRMSTRLACSEHLAEQVLAVSVAGIDSALLDLVRGDEVTVTVIREDEDD